MNSQSANSKPICRLTPAGRIWMTMLATFGLGLGGVGVWVFGRITFLGWEPEPNLTLDYFVTAHLGFEMCALVCLGCLLGLVRAVLRPRWSIRLHDYFCEKVDFGKLWGVWLFGWFFTWILFGGMTKTFDMLK